jgi:hypothetical protein
LSDKSFNPARGLPSLNSASEWFSFTKYFI